MSRFVRPETRVLKISNGDTLTVKKRLNHGEQQAAFARMYVATLEGSLKVNPLETGMAMVVAYLVDWTLTDEAGTIVAIRGKSVDEVEAAVNALDPDDFTEIKTAIEAHEQDMLTERLAAKKTSDGEQGLSATSPSPDDAGGDTSGSES
jgi:hypothetical protein